MTREELFAQDLGERARYMSVRDWNEEIPLPITSDGFEAMMELVTANFALPLDDAGRSIIAGFIHHINPEENTVTPERLARVLHKSISNNLTWEIDQKIKEKNLRAAIEAKAAADSEEARKRAASEILAEPPRDPNSIAGATEGFIPPPPSDSIAGATEGNIPLPEKP